MWGGACVRVFKCVLCVVCCVDWFAVCVVCCIMYRVWSVWRAICGRCVRWGVCGGGGGKSGSNSEADPERREEGADCLGLLLPAELGLRAPQSTVWSTVKPSMVKHLVSSTALSHPVTPSHTALHTHTALHIHTQTHSFNIHPPTSLQNTHANIPSATHTPIPSITPIHPHNIRSCAHDDSVVLWLRICPLEAADDDS